MSIEGGEELGDGANKGRRLPTRLVNCPYKVLLNGTVVDEFYDVRDAISAARATKVQNPTGQVTVSDEPSGRLVVQV
jgi:hypothetical protein